MANILVIESGEGRPLSEVEFTEEAKLQSYLEEHPSLIPIEDIDENAAPLLCIGREVGVPSGSIDLLFIGKDGVLTVVETKLAKNPEARRTVIGQIIEYTSYIYDWTADDIYRAADEYFSKSDKAPANYRGHTLDEVMEKFSGGDFSADEIKKDVEQNLRSGKIRLLIAVDKLVEPLRATVTFLNENSNFDIYLLQVRNFEESEARKVLIPTLFGYTKPQPGKGEMRVPSTEQNFFEDVKQKCDGETQELIKKLYEFTKEKAVKIGWGTGAARRSFIFHGVKPGLSIFTLFSNGSMWVNVGWAETWEKMLGKEKKYALLNFFMTKLGQILQTNVPKTNTPMFTPHIKSLAERDKMEQFEEAILSLCQKVEISEYEVESPA